MLLGYYKSSKKMDFIHLKADMYSKFSRFSSEFCVIPKILHFCLAISKLRTFYKYKSHQH